MQRGCKWKAIEILQKLNEEIANNKEILHYTKEVDKRLAEIQKSVSLATSAIWQMSNAALMYRCHDCVREGKPADISRKET